MVKISMVKIVNHKIVSCWHQSWSWWWCQTWTGTASCCGSAHNGDGGNLRKLWIIEGIHVVEDLYTVEGGHEVVRKSLCWGWSAAQVTVGRMGDGKGCQVLGMMIMSQVRLLPGKTVTCRPSLRACGGEEKVGEDWLKRPKNMAERD